MNSSKVFPSDAILTVNGVTFAALAGSSHVYQFILEWQALGRATELGILTSSSFALLQILFLFCFVAFCIGLRIRGILGLVISTLSLLGVFLGYAYWYSYSHRWLMGLRKDPFYTEHPEFVPPNLFGFVGAHWWDFVILVMTTALLILVVARLVRRIAVLRESPGNNYQVSNS